MTSARTSKQARQGEDVSATLSGERARTGREHTKTFSFFGGFGLGNFGNESTLQAILNDVRRLIPDIEVNCICTGPAATATLHNISTLPMSSTMVEAWMPDNRVLKVLRAIFVGVPNELSRWFEAFALLKGTDVLIIPGTGLLTDAFGVRSWGPYTLFRWTLTAKMRNCKVLFVSVGAGPIYSRAGRWLTRWALAFADFRSYRDVETKEFLNSIGASVANDAVYPDLAFSIADQLEPNSAIPRRRAVVGLGLMLYHRRLSADAGRESTYAAYLEQLILFANWLLAQGYDIRLLIGELSDRPVIAEFKDLLRDRSPHYDVDRIVDEPIVSVGDLLSQIAETDFVVATRFHNVLLALALNKPVVSISFHQKCTSLMKGMGLQEYCQEIKQLNAERLIEQFGELEKNAGSLKDMIKDKVADRRKALDEQYRVIFEEVLERTIIQSSSRTASVAPHC
jgi:polysaccharide pyruvyl transferase WcaK-like protein